MSILLPPPPGRGLSSFAPPGGCPLLRPATVCGMHVCLCMLREKHHVAPPAAELVRPPPVVRAPAKVVSSRHQSPTARIVTLFAWCGPGIRHSDEGVHVGNWPSIHGSLASSARVSSSSNPGSGTYTILPETIAHGQQHQPQQQQQMNSSAHAQAAVASVAAQSGRGNTNPACSTAVIPSAAEISTIKQSPEPQASTSSSNKPASIISNSHTNQRTCSIHPDDLAIIAQIFSCSPAAVMKLHTQQQQHMMAYARCVVQQRPLHFLDDNFEEPPVAQAERQQKQQHRRVTFPEEHQPVLDAIQQHQHQHQHAQSWAFSPQQPSLQQQRVLCNTSGQMQEQQFYLTCAQQQQRAPWAQDPLTHGILEPYWRPIEDPEPAHVPQRRRRTTSEIMKMRMEVAFDFHAVGSLKEYRSRQGRLNRSDRQSCQSAVC